MMSGIAWHIFALGAIGVSSLSIAYRTWTLIRLPLHLRWELAPVPHEKGKGRYGGSYLEEYEWWNKPRAKSRVSPLIYMAGEILLLRGIWRHNRGLWPLSFSLHTGMYLLSGMLLLLLATAVLSLAESPTYILHSSIRVASALAVGGYLLGAVGSIGLFLKRVFDSNLQPFNTISRYANLLFLAAVFVSGGYAWMNTGDSVTAMSQFVEGIITLDSGVAVTFPVALHIAISLLFVLYLPLTDMIHFIAKFFMFHQLRWDDEPQDRRMERELSVLLSQPVTWSAPHVGCGGERNWTVVVTERTSDEEEP
jgi:nitrate reductase gamma subunit